MLRVKGLLALCFVCFLVQAHAQLQVIPEANAQALAQKLVGGGVTISNVRVTGSSLSTGFFYNRGGSILGLDSGIVLSTGRVQTDGGFTGMNGNQNSQASTNTNTSGDPDLSALVSPRPTNDAVVLEFDFVPLGDRLDFRYVFSSEEYPTFTCTNFNDVFAFFISGPGITGHRNIALVPGTDVPVSINSINSGVPGGTGNISTCNAMGNGSPFTQYYVNNSGNRHFTHNGHTTILTASVSVQPCQVYHLKIAIADVNDHTYDSGVFLEAGSLQSEPVQIINTNPVAGGAPYLAEGCHTGGVKLVRSKKAPVLQTYQLAFGGTAVNGVDYQTVPSTATIAANDSVVFIPIVPIVDNLPEGIEKIKLYISSGCASTTLYADSIEVQLRDYDTLAIDPGGISAICRNGSQQLSAAVGYSSYQWSPALGLDDSNIRNPVATPGGAATYTCTANSGTCYARDSVQLQPKTMQLLSKKDVACVNGSSGEIRVSAGALWKAPVQFSINAEPWNNDSTFRHLPAGTYSVKVKDAGGCSDSIQVTLVQAFADLTFAASAITASCNGTNGKLTLQGSGGKAPYVFSVGASAFDASGQFTVDSGRHVIRVKDDNGCITTGSFFVGSDAPIVFTTGVRSASCSGDPDGLIRIQATGGSGNYQYAQDGSAFTAADSLWAHTGSRMVTVKDDKGCTVSQSVTVPLNQNVWVHTANDTTICEGAGVRLVTNSNAVQFNWGADASLSSTLISDPLASPLVTTTYYLTATTNICRVYDTVTVAVLPAPIANAGVDTSVCIGKTVTLNGSGGVSYFWSPASLLNDASISSPSTKPSQTSEYYLKVTDVNGCSSVKFDTVKVSLVPSVKVFAGHDTTAAIGQPLQLKGKELGGSGATVFKWWPATGLNDANILNPVAVLDKDVTYQLTMITPEGCEGTDIISIKVYKGPEIYVPSGFTPNGDGKNDLLRAIPAGTKGLNYFRVFNRWGQMIFATTTESKGWDGKINGILQPAGTYIWMAEAVDFRGNIIRRNGSVTLML